MANQSPEDDIDLENIEFSKYSLNYNAQIKHQQKSFENCIKSFQQSISLFRNLSSFLNNSNDPAMMFSLSDKPNNIDQTDKYFYNQFHRLIAFTFKFKGQIDNKNEKYKIISNTCAGYSQLLEEIAQKLNSAEQFTKLIDYFTDLQAALEVMHRERAILIVLTNSCTHKSHLLASKHKTNAFIKKKNIKNLPQQSNINELTLLNQEKANLKRKLEEYETIHARNYLNMISNFNFNYYDDLMSFFQLIDSSSILILHNCISKLMGYLSQKSNETIISHEKKQLDLFYAQSLKDKSIGISEYYQKLTSDLSRLFVVSLIDQKHFLNSFLNALNKKETIDLSQLRVMFVEK